MTGAAGQPSAPSSVHPNGISSIGPREISRARSAGMRMTVRSASVPTFQVARTLDLAGGAEHSTYTPTEILIAASARALHACPAAHTCLIDEAVHAYVETRVGLLVRRGDALVPLVFERAEEVELADLRADRTALQVQLREGARLPASRTLAPTFVISNLGQRRVDWFSAILYPDTAVTLAAAGLGSGGLAPTQLRAVLTCDHRLVDGVDGADFLEALQTAITEIVQ